jgi:hypothetical protein
VLSLFSEPGLLKDEAYLGRFGFIPSPRKFDSNATDFGYYDDSLSRTPGTA